MENRTRLTAEGREALNSLFAIGSIMDYFLNPFHRLTQRIPNGWRDFRMVQSKVEKLLVSLLDTVPVDQLKTVKRHMEMSTIHVGVKCAAPRPKDHWLITYDDLAELAEYATKTECIICNGKKPGCTLRRILRDLPIMDVSRMVVPCWEEEQK